MAAFTDEELVVLVQQYNHLYDLADPNYHNHSMRENSWEEIGHSLKTPGSECKAKWRSLRESFRKALLHRRKKKGQGVKKIKPWRLENQMEFVRSILISQSDDHERNIPPPSPVSITSSCNEQSPLDGASLNHEDATDTEVGGRNTPQIVRTNRSMVSRSVVEMLQHYIQAKVNKSNQEGDHIKKFFLSIEETVRTLPLHTQIKLKSQISSLVHNAELENIQSLSQPSK